MTLPSHQHLAFPHKNRVETSAATQQPTLRTNSTLAGHWPPAGIPNMPSVALSNSAPLQALPPGTAPTGHVDPQGVLSGLALPENNRQ